MQTEAWRRKSSDRRLKDRIENAIREMVRRTKLWTSSFHLDTPFTIVTVQRQFVLVNFALDARQLSLLPHNGRIPLMRTFAGELKLGFERISEENGL